MQQLTVAVAGNPNSGKTTLINAIAGTRLQVGNWPGVTIEKRDAVFDYKGRTIKLVDLPGTYSLSPYTEEEKIARDYLVNDSPDVIVDVIDSTNLERNLYLALQLIEMEIPLILALNIYDEVERSGEKIDIPAMEELLGIKVTKTVSTKKKGIEKLLDRVVELADDPASHKPKLLNYGETIEPALDLIENNVEHAFPTLAERYPSRWLSIKLLEKDSHVLEEANLSEEQAISLIDDSVQRLEEEYGDDPETVVANERYALSAGLTHAVLKRPMFKRAGLTKQVDQIVLNRILGVPIFLAAMWLVFKIAFDLSTPFVDWVDQLFTGPVSRYAETSLSFFGAREWMISLVTDGVIAGVGFVLTFVPVIGAIMFFLTLLEGSGYMARAAFVMDRAMHSMGLHGKSFIPMILGFGCNVPAIYATRTLDNPRDKVLTGLLIPLMSCSARLPVYVLFVGAFFAAHSGTVLWSLYVLGIAMAVLMGVIFKRTLFRGKPPLFIMELPPYRLPTINGLMIHTWEKVKHFIVKAGTIILAVSIIVWSLLNLPPGVDQTKDSYLAEVGGVAAPVFKPLGFGNWEAASSLITGISAKEVVVSTMGEIYVEPDNGRKSVDTPTIGEDLKEIGSSFLFAAKDSVVNVFSTLRITSITGDESEQRQGLKSKIQGSFSPLSAYAFMVFVLLYTPCVAALMSLRQEFGRWRWPGFSVAYQMTLAWSTAFVVYQGGTLLGIGGS